MIMRRSTLALVPILLAICAWTDVSTKDRVSDQIIKAFAVTARSHKDVHLVIRCEKSLLRGNPDNLVAYIAMPFGQLGADVYGRYRFDTGETKTANFSVSDNGRAVLLSDTINGDFFIPVLIRSTRLRIELGLLTGDQFFEFDTAGTEAVTAKLSCKPFIRHS